METIVLVIHLILALAIIGLVLMQRSSGGGLGIGGGGAGDFATARSTATALPKMTTWAAIAFFGTSLTLGYIASNRSGGSILDSMDDPQTQLEQSITIEPEVDAPAEPEVPVAP